MAENIIMPKLGFDMAEGTLVRWVVAEGEQVAKGAVLAEIETDKATVEVESTYEGVVLQHLVQEGSAVPVGEPIAVVGQQGEKVSAPPPKDEIAKAGEGAPGTLTPKELAAQESGEPEKMATVGEVQPKEGQEKPLGAEQPGAGQPGAEQPGARPPAGKPSEEKEGEFPGGRRASPLARRVAEERGVDLKQVEGTGSDGRITKKDVEAFLEQGPVASAPAPAQPAAPTQAAPAPAQRTELTAPPLPAFLPAGPPPPDQEVPLSRLRAAIGRRMVESTQQVPHFFVTHQYKIAPLMQLRSEVNAMLAENEKIPIDAFIAKAVAVTLRGFPGLNASLAEDKIIQHGQINVGIAVALDEGLLTVTLKDADRKPLRQLGVELRTMVSRVREGKVKPEDIEGSTFSISNLGMYDVEHFIAIINPPEAAILAIGSAQEVPVVEDGQVKPGLRMKATLSVDHRVTDGATAARFMQALALNLEQPMRLLV